MMVEKKRENEVGEKPLIARAWQEGQGEYFPKSHRTLVHGEFFSFLRLSEMEVNHD